MISGQTKEGIRRANIDDLPSIKHIADNNKEALGFIPRPALQRSISQGHIFVGENSDRVVGFVDFYHRRDQQTTLYHIAVIPKYREQGIGRALIEALIKDARKHKKDYIQLKCPNDLIANDFYRHLGFEIVSEESGKGRTLIHWRLGI